MWSQHIKLQVLLGLFSLSGISAFAQSDQNFSTNLLKVFKEKDTAHVSHDLAPNFSIAGHTGNGAKFRLNQIAQKYQISDAHAIAEQKVAKGKMIQYSITNTDQQQTNAQALFNPGGKLLYFSLFDQLYGLQRQKKPQLKATIPFENKNGSIYLQVKINNYDRTLRLLFDTGADGMAVGQQLADEIGLKITRENNASFVGGNTTIKVSDNNSITLDTLKIGGQGIAIFPTMSRDGDGIIGNTLIQKYITHIDYDKNVMSLYEFGDFHYQGKGTLATITMPSGVMLLPGQLDIIQGKSYPGQFVFDTGAAYDLICFRPFVRQNRLLVSGFKPESQAATTSMGISSPTFLGKSYQFAIFPLAAIKNLPVTLMGGSTTNEQWQPGVDGSIGTRLLSRYNMTINLADNEVYFVPNKLHALPQDFTLKNYRFGWDNQGQLKVLGTVAGGATSVGGLQVGQTIRNIAEYSIQQLQKKPSLLEEIAAKSKENNIVITLADTTTVTI